MKFATVEVQRGGAGGAGGAFIFGEEVSSFYLWSKYASLFPNDKLIQEVKTFLDFLKYSKVLSDHLQKNKAKWEKLPACTFSEKEFLLPFRPVTFRDFYCFEEHVQNARRGRGLEMIPEWYQAPIFYYSNPLSFLGPFEDVPWPNNSQELDCELEIACVLGKEIRNATLEEAREAIFGYTLLNDWTARDFQRFEMKVNMGPTKGKDFATTFGSWVITADELEPLRKNKGFDIEMELKINGEVLTRRSWSSIYFSFEEMLVRASQNCTLYPGEVLASGTMGKGCLLEHNLQKENKRWLQVGDCVEIQWLPKGPKLLNRISSAR